MYIPAAEELLLASYLVYCMSINVNPMSEADFPLSKSVLEHAAKPAAATKKAKTASAVIKPKSSNEDVDDRWGIEPKKAKAPTKKTTKKSNK
jgi:hypothetical protein